VSEENRGAAGDSSGQLNGVLETALYVSDLAIARDFYVDLFRCELLLDTPRLVALSVAGRSVLLLFQRGATEVPFATPGGIVPAHGSGGVQHLAFAIATGTADGWAERLATAGVPVESRVRWQRGGESIYVRDPDGHSIELATPGLWAIY
jgi:catechol 2,3-dioxygenase-like lactoylglutathione lyase family enzyme